MLDPFGRNTEGGFLFVRTMRLECDDKATTTTVLSNNQKLKDNGHA